MTRSCSPSTYLTPRLPWACSAVSALPRRGLSPRRRPDDAGGPRPARQYCPDHSTGALTPGAAFAEPAKAPYRISKTVKSVEVSYQRVIDPTDVLKVRPGDRS
jgi:hypothetical protein